MSDTPDSSGSGSGPEDSVEGEQPWWESPENYAFLKMERAVHDDEDNEAFAKRLIREAAPGAALSIINLSRSSSNDNTKLAASKYIVDFIRETSGDEETWESLLPDLVEKAEQFANASASSDYPPSSHTSDGREGTP